MRTGRMHRGAPVIVAGAAEGQKPNPQVNRATEASHLRHVPHSRRAPARAQKRQTPKAETRPRTIPTVPVPAAGAGRDVLAISLTPIDLSTLGTGRRGVVPGPFPAATRVSGDHPIFSTIKRGTAHSWPPRCYLGMTSLDFTEAFIF